MTKTPTNAEIREVWNSIEEGEPDISTEQLFARTMDHFNSQQKDAVIDEGDIAAALAPE